MNHSDLLKLLLPVELDGVYASDIALEGAQLDAAQVSGEQLLVEMHGDTADQSLADWERVLGLIAGSQTVEMRKLAVSAKLMEKGDLCRAYFIAMAAKLGITITITEYQPYTCVTSIDQPIYPDKIRFAWQAYCVSEYYQNPMLESIMSDLKPAHTAVIFYYQQGLLTENGDPILTEEGSPITFDQLGDRELMSEDGLDIITENDDRIFVN